MDKRKLDHVILVLLGIDQASHDNQNNPLSAALHHANITKFTEELILLNEEDIADLTVPGTPDTKLPIIWVKKLITVLKCYHHFSAESNGPINIIDISKQMYDNFRVITMDPTTPITHWQVIVRKATDVTPRDTDRENRMAWKKSIKLTASDYKEFKDDAYWNKYSKHFMETLEAQSIEHLVDEGHTPTDNELDESQRKWLFKVMKDKFTAPSAKTIVLDHAATKDTRAIWKDMTELYAGSITTDMRAQTISTYLSSNRLADGQWRGTYTNWIYHWKEQARTYNEISPDTYSDGQMKRMLRSGVTGVPQLQAVWTNHQQTVKSAGGTRYWTFEEYVTALSEQAKIMDAGNVRTRNPRGPRREVNLHIFDDGSTEEYEDEPDFSVQVHDVDTPVTELLAYQGIMSPSSFGSKPKEVRVMLDRSIWGSLSREDQPKW